MNMEEQKAKRAKWKSLVEEQEKSGKTQKQFCEERNLVLSQFIYYRSVLKQSALSNKLSNTVTPIIIKTPTNVADSQVKITLPNGFQCLLPSGAEISYVKRLMEALLSC